MQKIKSSPQLTQKIISLYLSGLDTYEVAEKCQCSQSYIINTLKRNSIPRRSTHSYTRKYIVDEDFFDLIQDEKQAYFLGLMYADGNNYVLDAHNYEMSIKLEECDVIILEKFRDAISPNTPIKPVIEKGNAYSFLKINSKKISQQLSKLGCIPAKSLVLTWPQWLVDPELQRHFIRGYFDGDGSLYSKEPTKTGHIDYGWQITSTDNFCNHVKKILEHKLQIHCSKSPAHSKANKITTTLSVGGNKQVKKVLDWLYQNATIYLPRKYNKYLELLSL